jgi:hypothetical protein
MDDDGLGPGTVSYLASCVEDGTATPEEARQLLEEFVRQADKGEVLPRLLGHMRDCVSAYLAKKRVLLPAPSEGRDDPIGVPIPNMEKAFGLKRVAPGQPRTDRDTLTAVAMEVLERRMQGETLEVAAEHVANDRKMRKVPVTSESRIRDAWKRHAADAITWLRIAQERPWTIEEQARLNELFYGNLWFCPPGADARSRQRAIIAEMDRRDADPSTATVRMRAVAARFDEPFAPKNRRNKKA